MNPFGQLLTRSIQGKLCDIPDRDLSQHAPEVPLHHTSLYWSSVKWGRLARHQRGRQWNLFSSHCVRTIWGMFPSSRFWNAAARCIADTEIAWRLVGEAWRQQMEDKDLAACPSASSGYTHTHIDWSLQAFFWLELKKPFCLIWSIRVRRWRSVPRVQMPYRASCWICQWGAMAKSHFAAVLLWFSLAAFRL